ncbi:MAG: Lrp/AsnC family transcriptional regulator [Actinobacteria bacterium]|jgi:Lrp/AsnC family transcriptional regulator for asnA, asnC and gidA|nr:Lrp/AsnC family transcriptional regulator [Actinomycetota bacterium]
MTDLDRVDKAIIHELQLDGRMPYTELSRRVGLSQPATRQRVNRLIDRGSMQVVAVTDPSTLGFDYPAMVGVDVDGDIVEIADRLAQLEEVSYLIITAGRYDILAEVVCSDADHLLRFVNEQIRPLAGVSSVELFNYLRLVKQTYTWGTR